MKNRPSPLLLVALLAILAGAWLFPRYFDQPGAYASIWLQRAQLWWAMRSIDGVSSEAMEIDTAANGDLWVTSKYSVLRVAAADGRRTPVMSLHRVRQQTGADFGAFNTAEVTADGVLWIGGWHGTVLRTDGDEDIRLISTREMAPTGRIHDIAVVNAEVYVGGDGLWRHVPDEDRLQRLDDGSLRVRALATDAAGTLVVASDRAVFGYLDGRLEPRWQAGEDDGAITALTPEPDGALLVGTRTGVVVLEPDGSVRTRLLAGEGVRGFSRDAEGRLWVATWQSGVAVPTDDGWRLLGYTDGLPDDSVSDLAIDAEGALWLAIYGKGAYRVEAARVRTLAQTRQRPVIDDGVQIHADACAASTQALGGPSESGQIAREGGGIDRTVFFDRRQVCPAAPGYRAAAGIWGTVRNDGVWLHDTGQVRTLALPPGLADSMVTALYRDHTGRWWLGSRHLGVFEQQADGWRAHGREAGLAANPIQAIDGDATGHLWVASYPRAARGGAPAKAGLHRFDGKRWEAIVPRKRGRSLTQLPYRGMFNDLASRTANDLRVLRRWPHRRGHQRGSEPGQCAGRHPQLRPLQPRNAQQFRPLGQRRRRRSAVDDPCLLGCRRDLAVGHWLRQSQHPRWIVC